MTHKDLLYVITIYDEGSFSAAARKLYISQSALSQAIRKLEQEFGINLFVRSGGTTKPTKSCRIFVDQGRRVLRAWNQFEQEMYIYAKRADSELSVGLPALLLRTMLPYFGPKYEELGTGMLLDIVEEGSNVLEELVEQEGIDLCIVRGPLHNPRLPSVLVLEPELLLAVPKDHPFCKLHPYRGLDNLEAVDLAELRDERFTLLKHQRIDYIWDPLFEKAGFEPKIFRRSGRWSNIVDYIRAGKAVGFIDEILALHDPREDLVSYYRLKSGPVTREILVAYHPGKGLGPKEQQLIDVLKTYPLLAHRRNGQGEGK